MENIGIKISGLVRLAIAHMNNTMSQKSFAKRAEEGLLDIGYIMKREQSVFVPIKEVMAIQAYVDSLEQGASYKRKFSTRGQINHGI